MRIKLASWNIAGGIKYKELTEDIDYLRDVIREINPDIICLQENHINQERSLARDAFKDSYQFITEINVSPSHNDSKYELGLAVLSKFEITLA